jgi:hypothetical protein
MKRRIIATVVVLASAIVVVHGHNFGTNPPTWNREVSRLVFDKCATCHRPEGTAFSLMTYQDAQPHAVAMKEAVLSRQMPPWGAVKGFGDFRNDQGLSQEQVEVITDWVEGGMLKGNNPNVKAEPPKFDKPPEVVPIGGLQVRDGTRLTSDLRLDGLIPGRVPDRKPMQVVAVRPDGSVEPLVWLYEYRNRYRHPFLFRTPVTLPVGTVIHGLASGATISLLQLP